ncbi:cytochrome P450 [Nocardia callitridis]|uniref:Cytochrome P450 n=1 Tax=Nocardia callitridis TaxID=648753 RepID=A0ABP9K5Z4_9NOCA
MTTHFDDTRPAIDTDRVDFFTDPSIVANPYDYFEALRDRCPVVREPHHGVIAVTGHEQATEVYRDHNTYSSCIAPIGPFPGLPFEPDGDDIGALIEQFRHQIPLNEHLVTFDPPRHTAHRALLRKLMTPRRLKENEEFMWRLADRQIDEFFSQGSFDLMAEYAQPFAVLVVADLLGVPEEDRASFRAVLGAQRPGSIQEDEALTDNPLQFLEEKFTGYIEQRRSTPRDDVLTELATATFPDGSTPEVIDVVHIACFLFAAGQDTTARLLSSALHVIAERPDIQRQLRENRDLIPNFIEETLRMESPVKSDFRLARTSTTLGGVDVPAGSTVMVLSGAVNRDPERFENPAEFRLDRPNAREHLAFGRGIHSCPGGPLARVEARVSIERLLDRMSRIAIDESVHGPADARTYEYEPTYILRGLRKLHLEYDPS